MGTTYTRQSSIADGDTITAALFNNEYNQLLTAFSYASSGTTGHQHDGTAAEGGNIHTIGDQDFLNKIVADSTNNRWGVFVQVSSSAVEQIRIQDGVIVPVTDNDIDLGTSSVEFKDAYFDGTVTSDAFAGPLTGDVTGNVSGTAATVTTAAQTNITSLGTLTALTVDNVAINGTTIGHTSDTDLITLADGNVTIAGELDLTTLDVSGNADIDGTLEADAITVDGTALNEYIADTIGAMVSSNTETNITVTYEDGDNTLDFVIGTLNQDTTGNAATFTASANNSTDETVYPVFVDGATGSQGAETDTGLTYNPSSGLLTSTLFAGTLNTAAQGNITSLGTLTALTVDDVAVDGKVITMTGSASDTAVFTAGTNGTLSIVTTDAAAAAANIQITADGTVDIDSAGALTLDSGGAINLEPASGSAILLDGTISVDAGVITGASAITLSGELDAGSLDISGDADIDGTLEADAYTVDGTALNEYIADTVGAMVSSNTETNITVSYEDGDNTLDFVIGTLNQDTTGTADNFTVSANNSTDETVYPVFVDGATGSQGAETDTGLTYNPSSGLLTITGELDAGSLDISGNADIDGTLEADAITVDGTTLAEYIADTAGAMVSSNTESGITVTYQDADNTIDLAVDAAQTGITSIYATDLILGEDSQTAIDFGTANEIDFKADNAARLTLTSGALYPVTDNEIDLGTSSLEFKDAYFDGTVTSDAFAGPLTGDVTGNVSGTAATVTTAAQSNITSLGTLTTLTVDNIIINGTNIGHTSDTDSIAIASDGVVTFSQIPVLPANTIDSDHYVDGSIDTAHIANSQITNALMADDAIDSAEIADGSIDTAHIADNQVTLAKMAGLARGKIIYGDASGDPAALAAGSANYVLTSDGTDISWASASSGMTSFQLEDDDGTEVAVSDAKEVKFIGSGITTNWTDTSTGSDGDPYDLTFTVDAAQTGITSMYATDLIIGEDSQTAIDFGTANEIDFKADNAARLTLTASALYPVTDNQIDLGTSSLEFKDAYFDGTVTSDAFAGPLTGDVTGNCSGTAATVTTAAQSNITSLGTLTTLTVDSIIINGTNIGHTSDTDSMAIASNGVVTFSQIPVLPANTIDSDHYVDGSIDTVHLSADAITGAKIADDALDSEHYTDGSIDTAHLAADAVTGAKIADDAIDSEHYTDASIDNAHLADDAVGIAELSATGTASSSTFLRGDNSWVTPTDTNTTYTAGGDYGLTLSSTEFRMEDDRRRNSTSTDIYSGNTHDYTFYDASVGIRWFTAGAEEMRLEDDGDLHVDGDVVAYSTTVSDKRLKHDINIIEDALDKVGQLNGCTFVFDADGKESAGLIAQDVEKVLPSAVTEKELPLKIEDGEKYKVLEYDQTIGLLVEAIKELKAKVEELEKK